MRPWGNWRWERAPRRARCSWRQKASPPREPNLVKMDAETGEGGRFVAGYGDLAAVDPTSGNPITRNRNNMAELLEFDGSAESGEAPLSHLQVEGVGNTHSRWLPTPPASSTYVGGAHVYTYGVPKIVPTVKATEATEVTAVTATLNGTVDPSGLEVSECRLEALPASETGFQRDEFQHLALSGATGGTFTLGFEGQTTAPLPYDADAEEVELALAALPAIGAGNVRAYAFEGLNVAFQGVLAATNVPQLQADSSALTPAGASAEVTTTQQGEGWGNARVAACEPEAAAIPTDEGPGPSRRASRACAPTRSNTPSA